jgi:predicted MFS family arabinose efflux permease
MKVPTERFLLILLAMVQFTHVVDFMIMMPLGPQLMELWGISTSEFTRLIWMYTATAGVAGLAAAPFVDRHDRRRVLLWTYAGFGLATLACAVARTPNTLLMARALCGLFGGIAGGAVMTIAADIVPPERRGAAMGLVGTSFSAAAAVGVPFGLYLAQKFEWEAPFFVLACLAIVNWILLWKWLPPVRSHLADGSGGGMQRFLALLRDANARRGLLFMAILVFGHFAIIPLLAPHLVGDLKLPRELVPAVYLTGGILSWISGPLIGRWADRHGRVRVFSALVWSACVVTLAIGLAPPSPAWAIIAVTGSFFVFGSGRFVPGQAIQSLAVLPRDRGAYMSLNGCVRDLAGGLSSGIAGWMVTKADDGSLRHFDRLGWMAVAAALVSLWLVRRVEAKEGSKTPAA